MYFDVFQYERESDSNSRFVSEDFNRKRPNDAPVPIDRDQFEMLPEAALDVKKGTNARRVLAFLARIDDSAFTRGEICDGVEIPDGSIGPVLSRLAADGLVAHKGQYWTLAPERLEAMAADGTLDELREEWDEYL